MVVLHLVAFVYFGNAASLLFLVNFFTPEWATAMGSLVWNLTQFIATITAAFAAYAAWQRTKRVETKTDIQTDKLTGLEDKAESIEGKAIAAATAARVAVDSAKVVADKAQDNADRLDDLTKQATAIRDNTNGSLTKLQDQLEESHKAQIAAFSGVQQQIIDAWLKQHEALARGTTVVVGGQPAAAPGGRRIDDVLKGKDI